MDANQSGAMMIHGDGPAAAVPSQRRAPLRCQTQDNWRQQPQKRSFSANEAAARHPCTAATHFAQPQAGRQQQQRQQSSGLSARSRAGAERSRLLPAQNRRQIGGAQASKFAPSSPSLVLFLILSGAAVAALSLLPACSSGAPLLCDAREIILEDVRETTSSSQQLQQRVYEHRRSITLMAADQPPPDSHHHHHHHHHHHQQQQQRGVEVDGAADLPAAGFGDSNEGGQQHIIGCPYHDGDDDHYTNSHKSQPENARRHRDEHQQQQQQQRRRSEHYQLEASTKSSANGAAARRGAATHLGSREPTRRRPPGSDTGEVAPPPADCSDCLAIPLVALVGDKQINGFIIPPQQSAAAAAAIRRQATREGPASPRHHQKERPPGHAHPQRPLYETVGAGNYGPPKQVASAPLEPKSDENCPMTGPLTVCDHIGSYPTEIILTKLDSAKKRLGESYFNLDSLFSDERDNSDDPFEKQQQPQTDKHTNSSDNARAHPHASAGAALNSDYPTDDLGANIYSPTADDGAARPSRTNNGYASHWAAGDTSRAPTWNEARRDQTMMIYPASSPSSSSSSSPDGGQPAARVQDDFVELVERQAISLADRRRFTEAHRDQRRRKPDEHRQSATKQQQQPHQRQRARIHQDQGSILASNQTLADRLFAGDSSTGATPASGRRRRRQWSSSSTKTATQKAKETATVFGRYNSQPGDAQRTLLDEAASSLGEPIVASRPAGSRATRPEPPERASHLVGKTAANTTTMKTRRSRRQTVSVRASSGRPTAAPVAADQRGPMMTSNGGEGGGEPSESDGDNSSPTSEPLSAQPPQELSSSELDGERAEPVCRAKSIYVSPRAALNDKKQWKYVVNAPERNPQIRQVIRVDICQNPFGPCSDQVNIPFGFTSECKQKYSKKKLLALDAQSGLLEVDTFFIPSCCVCQLVRTDTNLIEDNSSPLQQPPTAADGMEAEAETDTNLAPSPTSTTLSSLSSPSTQPSEDGESSPGE